MVTRILVISDVLSTERENYPGRHRIEGLCKYWAYLGLEVHILTPGPTVPQQVNGCTYHFTKTGKPSIWSRFPLLDRWGRRILRRILIPDPGILWFREASSKIDAIVNDCPNLLFMFSSFASASSHVIASSASCKFGIPWIADYRDIWTDNVHHKAPVPLYIFKGRQPRWLVWKIHSRIEARTIRRATLVTTLCESMAEILRRKVGDNSVVRCIPNGYDDDLISTQPHPPSGRFVIGYTGKLNNSRGSTELSTFFKTLADMDASNPALGERLVFRYWGYQTALVERLSEEHGVRHLIELHGPCTYEATVANQRESTVLLLMLPLEERLSKGVSSRKLFDYLAARRPIVGLVPANSDAGEILAKTQAGQVVTTQEALRQVLYTYLSEFKSSGTITYAGQENVLRQFTFSRLAADMLECFEDTRQAGHRSPQL